MKIKNYPFRIFMRIIASGIFILCLVTITVYVYVDISDGLFDGNVLDIVYYAKGIKGIIAILLLLFYTITSIGLYRMKKWAAIPFSLVNIYLLLDNIYQAKLIDPINLFIILLLSLFWLNKDQFK